MLMGWCGRVPELSISRSNERSARDSSCRNETLSTHLIAISSDRIRLRILSCSKEAVAAKLLFRA